MWLLCDEQRLVANLILVSHPSVDIASFVHGIAILSLNEPRCTVPEVFQRCQVFHSHWQFQRVFCQILTLRQCWLHVLKEFQLYDCILFPPPNEVASSATKNCK